MRRNYICHCDKYRLTDSKHLHNNAPNDPVLGSCGEAADVADWDASAINTMPLGGDDLRLFLDQLILNGSPSRREPEQPVPVERFFSREHSSKPGHSAKVAARREELADLFPDFPDLPIRRRFHSGGWGRRKRFNSLLLGQTMLATSSLEFDAMADLELDPSNSWYVEQPLRLRYDFDGFWRTCRPDLLVWRANSIEVIEVKYEAQAALQEERWAAIGAGFQSIGMDYRVVTERHLRRRPRFENVRRVYSCRHVRVSDTVVGQALDWLSATPSATAGELAAACRIGLNEVWSMVRRLKVAADLDTTPLGPETSVSIRVRRNGLPVGRGNPG